MRTSLDEDYAAVAARRPPAVTGEPEGGPEGRWQASHRRRRALALVAVLVFFGLLLATAAVQTARSAADRGSSRASLVAQVEARQADLVRSRTSVENLRSSVQRLQLRLVSMSEAERAVRLSLSRLGTAAGAEAVNGPGVRIVVDDNPSAATDREAVLDEDLQRLVNGLWVAGAEAVAVNRQRVTNLTAIREAGAAITVNNRSVEGPYVVEAIGDPEQLPARFIESDGGSWWLNLRSVYHLQFALSSEKSLTVPAAPILRLRHATRPGDGP